jgi:hypothetical protein
MLPNETATFRRSTSESAFTPLGGVIADNSSCLSAPDETGRFRVRLRLMKEDAYPLVDQIEQEIELAEQEAGTRLVAKLPFYAPSLPLLLNTRGVEFVFTTKQRPRITPADAVIERGTPVQVRHTIVVHALNRPGCVRALLQFNELLIGEGKADDRRHHASPFR